MRWIFVNFIAFKETVLAIVSCEFSRNSFSLSFLFTTQITLSESGVGIYLKTRIWRINNVALCLPTEFLSHIWSHSCAWVRKESGQRLWNILAHLRNITSLLLNMMAGQSRLTSRKSEKTGIGCSGYEIKVGENLPSVNNFVFIPVFDEIYRIFDPQSPACSCTAMLLLGHVACMLCWHIYKYAHVMHASICVINANQSNRTNKPVALFETRLEIKLRNA